eukprot:2168533-Rhodomonas_salina.1
MEPMTQDCMRQPANTFLSQALQECSEINQAAAIPLHFASGMRRIAFASMVSSLQNRTRKNAIPRYRGFYVAQGPWL